MLTGRERRYLQFDTSGIGYIVIPFDVDRDDFIATCYKRERVCILIEQGGGMVKDCYITKSALRDIYFPNTEQNKAQTGSAVIWVADAYNNKPVIVSVISKEDETDLLTEHKFKTIKNFDSNIVFIEGDAEQGILSLSVNSDEYSAVNINVKGSKDAEINIKSQGTVNVIGAEKVSVESVKEIDLTVKDSANGDVLSSVNVNGQDIHLKPQKEVRMGEFTEPVALANTLADILDEFITKVSQATVSTLLGVQPLMNAVDIASISNKLETIKSKTTKTN